MTHFENESPEIDQMDEKTLRLQNEYTDDDLLLELRRRGRLSRIEAENILPERYAADGVPLSYQIERAWRDIAAEAARLHVDGHRMPTGAKVDTVRGDGNLLPPHESARRVRFAVNYVVDR